MLGRLNHVALAVPDLAEAVARYRDTLGAAVSQPQALPEHGVTVVFVELENTKVELLEPLGENSPIAAFLAKNPKGGMHHVCYEVSDIGAARDRMVAGGAQGARRWRAEDRGARQAGHLRASRRHVRDADRTRGGLSMGWISGVAIYFIMWWTLLFVVLPIGQRSQTEMGHVTLGTDHGAPAQYPDGPQALADDASGDGRLRRCSIW